MFSSSCISTTWPRNLYLSPQDYSSQEFQSVGLDDDAPTTQPGPSVVGKLVVYDSRL